eukprot:6383228-Prymnesium_polylepis.1
MQTKPCGMRLRVATRTILMALYQPEYFLIRSSNLAGSSSGSAISELWMRRGAAARRLRTPFARKS